MKGSWFVFPMGMILIAVGCAPKGPGRLDPFAGIQMSKTPAYPNLSVALLLSENTKNSIQYGQEDGRSAWVDLAQIIEQDIEMYRKNFKTVVKIDKMADARSIDADLIVVIDTFFEPGIGVNMDGSLIVLDPNEREIDRIRGHSERSAASVMASPGAVVTEAFTELRNQLEDGLRASTKLREYSKSRTPKTAPAPVAAAPVSGTSADRPAKASPKIVAVFDLYDSSKKLDKDVPDQLTNYLGTLLTKSGVFKVIPRDQIRSRLQDEKEDTFKKCYDESCQIELGKALSAEKSLATTLIQVGNKCAVTANLFDLKTETSEDGASVETGCSPDELLDAIKEISRQLAE